MSDETTATADPAAEAAAEAAAEEKASVKEKKSTGKDRRLASYVHLSHPVTGTREVFGPEDEVPDWAQELITNPKAWEGGNPHAIDETAPVPGANEFATTGAKTPLSKTQLYALDKEELIKLSESAGIEASMHDSKRTLVENLTAR